MSIESKREAMRKEDQAKRLWSVEGGHCVSSLVHTLATNVGCVVSGSASDLLDLMEQALELSTPIDDWEEAAREAGWSDSGDNRFPTSRPSTDAERAGGDEICQYADDWQDACERDDLEPHQREVFEHWIVSDWLADELAKRGEKVDKDFTGLTIWARTTSGQAIYADWVIEQTARRNYTQR